MPVSLTICTTATPDRVLLLRRMLATIDAPCGVIVAVFGDWTDIDLPRRVLTVAAPGPFSLGRGRNLAAEAARTRTVAFIDADMLLPPGWLAWAAEIARRPALIAPTYRRLQQYPRPLGKGNGYGNLVLPRAWWKGVGGYVETEAWGGEDTDFMKRLKARYPMARLYRDDWGLLHQWHEKHSAWHAAAASAANEVANPVKEGDS